MDLLLETSELQWSATTHLVNADQIFTVNQYETGEHILMLCFLRFCIIYKP